MSPAKYQMLQKKKTRHLNKLLDTTVSADIQNVNVHITHGSSVKLTADHCFDENGGHVNLIASQIITSLVTSLTFW